MGHGDGRARTAIGDGPKPGAIPGGMLLPNGWKISPAGTAFVELSDMVSNLSLSPDGKILVASHPGWLKEGIDVIDTKTQEKIQSITLPAVGQGLHWSADGKRLYVAGGNATGPKNRRSHQASIYVFDYRGGRLDADRMMHFARDDDPARIWWSDMVEDASSHRLYAVDRTTGHEPGSVYAFDLATRKPVARVGVGITPYQIVSSRDGRRLFVSNWSDGTVSVIDTRTNSVLQTLRVGANPNAMVMSSDDRLFVACSNDNSVFVIDGRTLKVMDRILTTQTPQAPEGATPDALAIDGERRLLYIANAGNNAIAVVDIARPDNSAVLGFIPTGWYPSALALGDNGRVLYIADAKGERGRGPNPYGSFSPLRDGARMDELEKQTSTMALQLSTIASLSLADLKRRLPAWTRQVVENTPYRDSLLSEARPPREPSILPQRVGAPSPIQHVIYIIKENHSYDNLFGDLRQADGDPSLTLFGWDVTPNQHELASTYMIFDNLYCDGEVSVDGHSWSDSAYATDFNEKQWPPLYGGYSVGEYNVKAMVPSAGHIWDLARKKGLTYRSYGEFATRVSTGPTVMEAAPGAENLKGHIARDYFNWFPDRDTDRARIFIRDLHAYDRNYRSPDPERRLPNFVIMSMPEDHTMGTRPGANTPIAMVANSDYAIGQVVDAVSHSPYWPQTAIFIIEDDPGGGPDHIDARRTVGLVISPYTRRRRVDSTLYTTSSMIRSMELLLGLPPMSQYDAAAMPMYAAFGVDSDPTPFTVIAPKVDVNAINSAHAYGAGQSLRMDFSGLDKAPMHDLSEVIWKDIRGMDSAMPLPAHRFRPIIDIADIDDDD
ncbi:hypothetical protein HLH29_12100 [Gluconacetobacter tumulicola]|uniref:Phosphoesterase n=2 Tax=Gluconacetobacter tumulicola TaxID=1017177 RepID=A0A7W4JEQ2_9PROT|nr:hypothetical protein [Gluconacetobacter tumulicola]